MSYPKKTRRTFDEPRTTKTTFRTGSSRDDYRCFPQLPLLQKQSRLHHSRKEASISILIGFPSRQARLFTNDLGVLLHSLLNPTTSTVLSGSTSSPANLNHKIVLRPQSNAVVLFAAVALLPFRATALEHSIPPRFRSEETEGTTGGH